MSIKVVVNKHYKCDEKILQRKVFSDPRNEHYPLLGSPFPILTILGIYLYFVNSLGPRLMESLKPFQIETIINWYNIAQVLINLFIGIIVSFITFERKVELITFQCIRVSNTRTFNLILVCDANRLTIKQPLNE